MTNLSNVKAAQVSVNYEVWRDRFLRNRLRPALWIAVFFALTITVYLWGESIFDPKQFKAANLYIGIAVELGLLTCLALHQTELGRRYPSLLFLGFSWSLTIIVQVGAALIGQAEPQTLMWCLAFLTQATLMPVRWPLHVVSQLGVVACYIGVNWALNLTIAKMTAFHFAGFYLYLFWFCFICDLSVYLYERLQRDEFETRRSLAVTYDKLEAAEAKYRSIFENAGEGIFQSTPDGRYITANPALARIYGYDLSEEVTDIFTDIEHQLYVEPNRRAEFIRQIEEHGRVSDFESQIYRKDGSIVWISENARTVRDANGKVLYYEGLIEDITQRKQAEEALRVFIHALSHDLRNPVAGMLMVLKNWEKKPGDGIAVPRSILLRMIQGSEQQLKLINSLLEVQASEVRGLVLQCEPLHLRGLIDSAIADLEPMLVQHQTAVKNQVSADLPLVNADSTQLWRVFSNLIANALKHNAPGLNLTMTATIIEVDNQRKIADRSIKMIRCTVEDDGVGIPSEQCDRLFDLYARGSQVRHSLGLGLGLYLCRQIIAAHGGEIGVISNPGAGATFWFTLPIVDSVVVK
ncbi:PAS domain-containing sensor histidine kinase [Kamptonema sp. UHCC 0994]|uniref:PAS domain-containing sensor histidine kinase n=1 Tax=Kamptonema sp. UHCC 0994 TaxID=3031329 RepID=UPI0023B8EA4B|nr:PAS domain-containing sensor histidine kinase [Kamptonema sp. UHCC 0994]MDF0555124.1 PAS domain-containing sensor histidine kinase [Kamptonema sp. UHCC 0994]